MTVQDAAYEAARPLPAPRRCACGNPIPASVRPDEVGGRLCSSCYNGILGVVGDDSGIDADHDRIEASAEAGGGKKSI